ncbi:MAG: TonB-dependent receptor [Ectothiorhodospiraceae bacterium]|nr:TonB-dependent receptor [Ectothiorhodospiraceae bacterium]MCH8505748.1 TonB-dependent receptor [Ectothiorhodospiraceae bacterium]
MDKKHVLMAFAYALLGVILGIYMAASKNHGQLVTHAHLLLLGFVTSFIYGVSYRLWLPNARKLLATLQFFIHHAGTVVLVMGLFLLYGRLAPEALLGPVLGVASVVVLLGLLLMVALLLTTDTRSPQPTSSA